VKFMLLTLMLLSAAGLVAQDATIEEVDRSPVQTHFAAGGQIRMDLCPSSTHIVGTDEDHVRVSYEPRHTEKDVKVRLQVTGKRADVRVARCPHNNFEMTIEVPKSSDLYVRMFAGELGISGISGNKDVQLHAGELTIDVGEPATYAHVDASVLTGDLEAPPFDVSKGGLFRSFERTGGGNYRLHAHVGAGQIELR
jgi:hypothetical protein